MCKPLNYFLVNFDMAVSSQVCLDADFLPTVVRITKHPRSQVVVPGRGFSLKCGAVSTSGVPLEYQWYRSGKKLIGSTKKDLVRYNYMKT